ncbi:MAG: ribonuclease HI family protein [Patescibacteria group bacterium]
MQYSLYTDGGSRGNPGPSALGFVIYNGDEVVEKKGEYLGVITNNQAEYTALVEGLRAARHHRISELSVCMDSELIIKQMKGEYRVKDSKLIPLFHLAKEIASEFDHVTYTHVRREKNTVADAMVNEALDHHLATKR